MTVFFATPVIRTVARIEPTFYEAAYNLDSLLAREPVHAQQYTKAALACQEKIVHYTSGPNSVIFCDKTQNSCIKNMTKLYNQDEARVVMPITKSTISAVHDDDLIGFLDSLGVLTDMKHGKATCKFCRQPVTLDNLVAVFPESGDIKFACDRRGCLSSLAEHRAELRGKDQPANYECRATT